MKDKKAAIARVERELNNTEVVKRFTEKAKTDPTIKKKIDNGMLVSVRRRLVRDVFQDIPTEDREAWFAWDEKRNGK